MFQVTLVQSADFELFEQLGTKTKFWYDDLRYLFKAGREGTGENWAEVVCARIAQELGLPHATYELAETTRLSGKGVPTRGVTTPNFTPRGARLVLGNELIVTVAADEKSKSHNRKYQHTVLRLAALLCQPTISMPSGWDAPDQVSSAAGVMAGYLLLDALVGNQDRHEENWGLIATLGQQELAPTFDHASSLGRNETDARRREKLLHKDPRHGVAAYAAKALSQLHDREGRRLTTDQAFIALSGHCRSAALYWLEQLGKVDEAFFRETLAQVPNDWISDLAREFAVQMLLENRKRLLQVKL